ncbi:MAG: hypothetical protein ACJATT_003170 [Myxococcota bacterium]|jgi:hypothetical protein
MMRLLWAVAFAACSGGEPEPVGCRDDGDCPGDSICTDTSECEVVECLTSAQCGLNTFCDLSGYTCVDGCESDVDCLSGSTCDALMATCVETECLDSQLDCRFGDACNQDVGACEPVVELCSSCSGTDVTTCLQDIGGECRWFTTGQYCLPPCSPFTDQAKLPRGFACLDFDPGDAEDFNLFGDCNEVDAYRNPDEDTE